MSSGLINRFFNTGRRAAAVAGAPRGGILSAGGTVPPAQSGGFSQGSDMPIPNARAPQIATPAASGSAEVRPPQATPVGGPGGLVGRRQSDDGAPLETLAALQGYQPESAVVLTVKGSKFELTPAQQRVAIALEVQGRVIVVWSGLTEDRHTFSNLVVVLQREKYAVSAKLRATIDLIATLYEGAGIHSRGSDVDAGSHRTDEMVNRLFSSAHAKRASDIHVYRKQSGTEVWFRIDGTLLSQTVEDPDWGLTLGRAIFTRGDSDTKQLAFNPKVPQAMTITRRLRLKDRPDPVDLRLRFQSSPTFPSKDGFDAFDMVLRVITIGIAGAAVSLEQLGFLKAQNYAALRQLDEATGLTILIGATGSGKSTTLQSMVEYLHTRFPGQKILAVEDPPEYELKARQVPVVVPDGPLESEEKRVSTAFLRALRAAMRMDPDSLLIGEIRDPASASLAGNATLTGHRVLTTFHASSLVHCLQRLKTNGLELDVLGSEGFLRSIISQSLLPLLCPSCSQPLESASVPANAAMAFARLKDRLGRLMDLAHVRVRGPGCDSCDKTGRNQGLRGRSALVEMLVPDMRMRSLITEGRWLPLSNYWAVARLLDPGSAQGAAGLTKLEHGLHLVAMGKACPILLDGFGVGKIGDSVSLKLRLEDLKRTGVLDQGEFNDAVSKLESEPFFPGLGPGAKRGVL